MNWDWDKLQEKRQHQQGWRPDGRGNRENPSGGFDDDGERSQDRNQDRDPGRDARGYDGEDRNGRGRNSDPRRPAGRTPFGGGREPVNLNSFRVPGAKWWILGLVGLWMLSGIYIVRPDEAGVVLQFGKYVRTTPPGPHYHLPYPIEDVLRPKVTTVRQLEVGYRNQSGSFQQGREQPVDAESSMLTGDENIVLVQFNIQYNIKPDEDGPVNYLFNVTQPDEVVKKAAEAAMREVIGKSTLESALTVGRAKIQDDVTRLLQDVLDMYKVGIHVVAVQMQSVQPPHDVRDAFKDVASAREDKEKVINDAQAYRRDILPKAQGYAAQLVNEAEAYKQTRIRSAEGEASRFLAVLHEYEKAEDVTRKRMLFEAMEEILGRPGMEKLILPSNVGDNVLPLLPLNSGASSSSGSASSNAASSLGASLFTAPPVSGGGTTPQTTTGTSRGTNSLADANTGRNESGQTFARGVTRTGRGN